jgi:ATP-binding cassette subfamily C protein LapB
MTTHDTSARDARSLQVRLDRTWSAKGGGPLSGGPLGGDRKNDEAPAPRANGLDATSLSDDDAPLSWRDMLSPRRSIYGQAVVATVTINLLALAGSLVIMNVYDRVLPNQAMETLTALVIGACLAAIFEFTLRTTRGALIDAASRDVDIALSAKLFRRVLGARGQGGAGSTGVRLNTLREFETLREFFTAATLTTLGDLPFAALFLLIIAMIAGPLVIAPLALVGCLLIVQLALQAPLTRLTAESFRDTAQKNAVLVETLVGMETIKSLSAQRWAQSLWDRSVTEHVRVGLRTRFLSALSQNSVGLMQTLATMALLVHGVILIGQGAITAGALIAAMMLMGRAVAPIAQGAMLIGRLHHMRVAWSALAQLANAPQERPAGSDLVRPSAKPQSLRFEDVSFAHQPEAPPALAQVSFTIRPGERVGLIGGIGGGKSTALRLMMRLGSPQMGRILINELALEGLDPDWLRGQVGYLEQQPMLFSGTIRSNMSLHRPEASDDELIHAAAAAGALAWINRLPRGFDTRLGERGAGLSGGQRQSLALARALVGGPSMLLLDEPTSDMDGRTEAEVVRQLAALIGRRTLVLVTHRPAVLDLVDRLIVFDGGRLMADGPKAEVLDLLNRRAARPAAAAASEGAR